MSDASPEGLSIAKRSYMFVLSNEFIGRNERNDTQVVLYVAVCANQNLIVGADDSVRPYYGMFIKRNDTQVVPYDI